MKSDCQNKVCVIIARAPLNFHLWEYMRWLWNVPRVTCELKAGLPPPEIATLGWAMSDCVPDERAKIAKLGESLSPLALFNQIPRICFAWGTAEHFQCLSSHLGQGFYGSVYREQSCFQWEVRTIYHFSLQTLERKWLGRKSILIENIDKRSVKFAMNLFL